MPQEIHVAGSRLSVLLNLYSDTFFAIIDLLLFLFSSLYSFGINFILKQFSKWKATESDMNELSVRREMNLSTFRNTVGLEFPPIGQK